MPNQDPATPNINNGQLVYADFCKENAGYIDVGMVKGWRSGEKDSVFSISGWIFMKDDNYLANVEQGLFSLEGSYGTKVYELIISSGVINASGGVKADISLAAECWNYFSINYGVKSWEITINGEVHGSGPIVNDELRFEADSQYLGILGQRGSQRAPLNAKVQSIALYNQFQSDKSNLLSDMYSAPLDVDDAIAYYDLSVGKNIAGNSLDPTVPSKVDPLRPTDVTYKREIMGLTCINNEGKVIDGCVQIKDSMFATDYNSPYTIEAWVFVPDQDTFDERKMILTRDARYNDKYSMSALLMQEDRKVAFVIYFAGDKQAHEVVSDEQLIKDSWNHVAAVYIPSGLDKQQGKLRIFVNGGLDNEVAVSFDRPEEDKCVITIGAGKTLKYSCIFPGYIQEVRYWNEDRSQTIDTDMYRFPEAGIPLAYWVFGLDDRPCTDLMMRSQPAQFLDGAHIAPQTVQVTRPNDSQPRFRILREKGSLKILGERINSEQDVRNTLMQLAYFTSLWNMGGKSLGYPQLDYWANNTIRIYHILIQVSDIADALSNFVAGTMTPVDAANLIAQYSGSQLVGAVSAYYQSPDNPTTNGTRKRKRENPFDEIKNLTERDQQFLQKHLSLTKTILSEGDVSFVFLSLLQALEGDCIEVITLDIDVATFDMKIHTMLVDGGRRGTAATLYWTGLLLNKYDVICSTHQDRDHIEGLIRLFELTSPNSPCDEAWMNKPPSLSDADLQSLSSEQLQSYRQAARLIQLISNVGLEPDGKSVDSDDAKLGDHLNIRFIGPTKANLDRYQASKGDSHVINRASIMHYLTHDNIVGFNAILTADGEDYGNDPSHHDIRTGYGPATANFSFMKVPHHGSAVSEDAGFYNAYKAKYFLISAKDYTSARNPRFDTLSNIINANTSQTETFYMYFTNAGTRLNDAITQVLNSPDLNPTAKNYGLYVLKAGGGRMTFIIAPKSIILGPLNVEIHEAG